MQKITLWEHKDGFLCIFFVHFYSKMNKNKPQQIFFFRQSGSSALAESSVTMIRQEHKNKHFLAARHQSPLQSTKPTV